MGYGQFIPRHIQRDTFLLTSLGQIALALAVDVALEGSDRAFGERELRVWDDFLPVEADDAAKAPAIRTSADGGIKREECGRCWAEAAAIDWGFEDLAEAPDFDARVRQQAHATTAKTEGNQGGFMEARGLCGRNGEAILNDERLVGVLGNSFFAEAEPFAKHERPRETGAHKFFGDGWPSEPGWLLHGEG